jgi:tetratricopeptide (TPR) repeat protein
MLLAQNEAHKHVMYPCISHELTPIAILDDQGVFGFEGAFLMDELIPIQLYQRLPKGGYATTFEYKIKNWQNFINASSILQPKTTKTNSIAQDNPMTDQTLSPLEKAKALLAKAKSQTTASPTPVATPTQVQAQAPTIVPTSPQQSATSAELSPLEKAKALLAKAKAQNSSATAPTPAPTPILAQTPAPQAVNDEKLVQMQAQMQAQMQEALSLLNQVQAKLNPINPQVQFLCEQGENAFMAQNLTVAQQFFESALLIDPNHVDSLNNLAVLSQAQGNAWKALSFFLIALQIQPNHEITTENLIALLEKSPDLALAAKLILV